MNSSDCCTTFIVLETDILSWLCCENRPLWMAKIQNTWDPESQPTLGIEMGGWTSGTFHQISMLILDFECLHTWPLKPKGQYDLYQQLCTQSLPWVILLWYCAANISHPANKAGNKPTSFYLIKPINIYDNLKNVFMSNLQLQFWCDQLSPLSPVHCTDWNIEQLC